MPIYVPEPIAERGKKDARRHREKQKEVIRKNLPEIIAEESIITKSKGKTVKVPIRSLDIPHFRPGTRKGKGGGGDRGGAGIGQGSGKPGDVIGRRPGQGQGQKPGQPGEEPGVDYIETEIDIEEIIEMMLDDLGLPKLEQKDIAELEVILGFKIRGIQKSGPRILLDPRRSTRDGFGRFWAFLEMLVEETGKDEVTCSSALNEADGSYVDALALLQDPDYRGSRDEVEPFAIIHESDLRFHKVQEDVHHESNAVVIAMMDVSGSMSTLKKYLARSLLFWLVSFLRTLYDTVEVRFIVHHTQARLVPEEEFFHTGESGGTRCASAYELANTLVDTEYPTNRWNVYPIHFSDGEDFSPASTVEQARKLIEKGVSMLGYGEIQIDEYYKSYSVLLPAFTKEFSLSERTAFGVKVAAGKGDFPFLGVVIKKKEHILPALREFLKKNRWA